MTGAELTNDRGNIENQAYLFDGVDDKISFGDVLEMSTNDFSISLWNRSHANSCGYYCCPKVYPSLPKS